MNSRRLNDRVIGLLVLAVVVIGALGLGVVLAWHSYASGLATTV